MGGEAQLPAKNINILGNERWLSPAPRGVPSSLGPREEGRTARKFVCHELEHAVSRLSTVAAQPREFELRERSALSL